VLELHNLPMGRAFCILRDPHRSGGFEEKESDRVEEIHQSGVWRKERPTGPETLFRFEVWGRGIIVSDPHQPQRFSVGSGPGLFHPSV
jgi:hypothetical protein